MNMKETIIDILPKYTDQQDIGFIPYLSEMENADQLSILSAFIRENGYENFIDMLISANDKNYIAEFIAWAFEDENKNKQINFFPFLEKKIIEHCSDWIDSKIEEAANTYWLRLIHPEDYFQRIFVA